ncbi:MAG: hypothetical protein HC888_02580 [Candidatus Competibacteraceae bacterium]|nr:hypothetical protein [Candidatus Competibacteraceae bacterium]
MQPLSTIDLAASLDRRKRYFSTATRWMGWRNRSRIRNRLPQKPNGLWYAFGGAWLEWCEDESYSYGGLLYEVELDDSRIYRLRGNKAKVEAFTEKYLNHPYVEMFGAAERAVGGSADARRFQRRLGLPDWERLAEKYDGFEVNPYGEHRLDTCLWYYSWDVPSGCLWNKRSLLSVSLFATQGEEGEWNLCERQTL